MPFFDLPLDQLHAYRPERREPADFDAFWQRTLADAAVSPLNAVFTPVDAGLRLLETFDVEFNGWAGHPIKGWLLVPKHRTGPLPCVVEYIGYGGGRGFPSDWLLWSAAGYAHLVMDTRGQGSVWQTGDTPDPAAHGDPHAPGFLTLGARDPAKHYYCRLITDAMRAVEAARAHPAVDGRIAVAGGSQGGGLALAVAGLASGLDALLSDQPFLCHYQRASEIADKDPYAELARYCAAHPDRIEELFTTMSYLDGINFAARADAPGLFSVGLMDEVCPPSTIFAAVNHYRGPKELRVYPYSGHDGGGAFHGRERLRFLEQLWE
jgi:cephalosporin-C deacetylase